MSHAKAEKAPDRGKRRSTIIIGALVILNFVVAVTVLAWRL